jgi:DNA-binding NarL/FixJ family response regulator
VPDPKLEVLVVDDHPDTLRLLARELGDAGLAVRCASSGEQAIEAVEATRPDAVLLDVRMAGIDGFETCARLRRVDADLPIVFITGLGETEHVVRGFEAGGTDYVTKPVSAPEVVARLLAHARVARLARATREAVDAAEQPMLALDGDRVSWLNRAARALLGRLAPDARPDVDAPLPAPFAALARARDGAPVLATVGGVEIEAVPIGEPGPSTVLSLRAAARGVPARPGPALTAREAEVLTWVARGKTNRDIADILGMSPRTVNKHLEHVFEKLGVETRTAAAAAAQRLRIGS